MSERSQEDGDIRQGMHLRCRRQMAAAPGEAQTVGLHHSRHRDKKKEGSATVLIKVSALPVYIPHIKSCLSDVHSQAEDRHDLHAKHLGWGKVGQVILFRAVLQQTMTHMQGLLSPSSMSAHTTSSLHSTFHGTTNNRVLASRPLPHRKLAMNESSAQDCGTKSSNATLTISHDSLWVQFLWCTLWKISPNHARLRKTLNSSWAATV